MKHVFIPVIIFIFGPVMLFLGSGILSGNPDKMEYMLLATGIWFLMSVGKVWGDRGKRHLTILEIKACEFISAVIPEDTLAYKNITIEMSDTIRSWSNEQAAAKWGLSFDYDRAALAVVKKTLLAVINGNWSEDIRISACEAYKYCLLQQYRRLDITKEEYEKQSESMGGVT